MEVILESIHSGMTKNFNYYSRGELERIAETWVKPYNRPVLKHHDMRSEPLGRVVKVNFRRSHLKRGAYCTELTTNITDPEAQPKIIDGRYNTVSVGTTVFRAVCSICGNDWAKDYCEHRKGRVYDGKLCYWKLGLLEHDEVSFVNAPADEYAQVIAVRDTTSKESREDADGTDTINEWRMKTVMSEHKNSTDAPEEIVQAFTDNNSPDTSGSGQATDLPPEPQNADAGESAADQEIDLKALKEELESKIAELKQGLDELTNKHTALEGKHDIVVQQNAELARLVYAELVEHYCDVAVMAGLFENKEAAKQAAAEKKPVELRHEIAQILMQPRARTIDNVDCPGGDGTTKTETLQADDTKDTKKYTVKDLEDVISNFMTRRNG